MTSTRCDLHVHSAASVGNDEWYTRVFGCPESYADPMRQYELCKARGMTLVTLTDHDTIAGALTLIDRPDFFISEEVTTIFPENGCVMHVLTWNITQAQHDQIQAVRGNVYRLCEYLNRESIAHGLAHPLLSPNWRLDGELFEKVLLLFPTLEGVNGLVDRRITPDLDAILDRLTPEVIAALSQRHGIAPNGAAPHRKAMTAGSDDHVHRRCGTVYSEIDGPGGAGPFLKEILAGRGRVVGEQAHLNAMTMCVKNTTYHHLQDLSAEGAKFRNPFVEMMDLLAGRDQAPPPDSGDCCSRSFVASLCAGLEGADLQVGKGLDILDVPDHTTDEDDARIIGGLARLSNEVIERSMSSLIDGLNDFDLYRIFGASRDLAGALVTAAPVFFAAHHFGQQERQALRVREQWRAFELPARAERLAVFSDSLEQVDGVSTWCTRFVSRARAGRRDVLVPHCGPSANGSDEDASRHQLPAITSFTLPLYDQLRFYVPSLIDTLVWGWREGLTHVELATPGPMGLCGLLMARVFQLPVTASYHTELPALINHLGGNALMDRGARRYLGWFYGRVDRVFAFSSRSRDALLEMGVAEEKVLLLPQAVDPDDFSPCHRSSQVFEVLNLAVGNRPVILSVGRLSREKNVPIIIDAVEKLQQRHPPPLLLIVGDGPGRKELEERYGDREFVRFAGVQRGEVLKKVYASASLFVFASQIDTLGLVNMEAMSSGIPVLVPEDAGIAEFVTHGLSAECYPFGTEGLAAAMERVLDDPLRAKRLATGGRQAMLERWKNATFSRLWESMVQ